MPKLSRWFIRTGMLYFIVAMIMATVMLIQPMLGWSSRLQLLRPVYLHFIFIGWVSQIIMGVGYWMFPKLSREKPRGSEKLGWAVFIMLNIGLILRAIAEPANTIAPDPVFGALLVLAAAFLLLAGWGFIANTWGRIKER